MASVKEFKSMTQDRAENEILHQLRSRGPLKGTELVVHCFLELLDVSGDQFLAVLEELVASGRVKEIEYESLDVPDRIKSIYFLAIHNPVLK